MGEYDRNGPHAPPVDVSPHATNDDPTTTLQTQPTIDSPNSKTQVLMAVLTVCLVYNAYLFTQLMPAVTLSYINADLGPDDNYPWITICWNLGAAVIVTIGGRLADIFGRRWFLITGAISSVIGSVIGATGHSISQMIVAGVFLGIGGGFQEMVFSCVQEIVPNRYRLLVLGCVELSNLPAMLSSLIAFAFIKYSDQTWRVCYWWMFAFEALSVIALFFFYKPPSFHTKHREEGKTKFKLFCELDFVGLFLFAAGCILILLGVNWGGRVFAWKSAGVIVPIVLSGITFICLGFWETYMPLKYPILPPKLFRKWREFTVILGTTFVGGMLYYSMNILWPLQSQVLFIPSTEPIMRGLYGNMFSFGTILSGILVVTVVAHAGHERWQLIGFLVVQTAMIGSMATVGIHDKSQAIATIIIVAAVVTPPQYLAYGMVSLSLDDQTDIGVTAGLTCTFRLVGGAIATAIYTAIRTSRFGEVLPNYVADAAKSTGYTGSTAGLMKAALNGTAPAFAKLDGVSNATISAALLAVKEAYASSFQRVYEVAVAFGGVAIILAAFTKSIDVERKNNQRAVLLENEKHPTGQEKS